MRLHLPPPSQIALVASEYDGSVCRVRRLPEVVDELGGVSEAGSGVDAVQNDVGRGQTSHRELVLTNKHIYNCSLI